MTEPEDVVVDMDSVTEDVMRIARIVGAETPARPSVMWRADSEPEVIRVGGPLRRVPYGGLRYLALVAPELLDELLSSRPTDLFIRALHAETGEAKVEAKRLKSVLTECGLESSRVDRAWSAVSKSFGDQPGVRPSGERSYRPDRSVELRELGRPQRRESFREPAEAPTPTAFPTDVQASPTGDPPNSPARVAVAAPGDSKPSAKLSADNLRSAMSSQPDDDTLEQAARAKTTAGVQDSDAFRQWISSPSAVQRHLRLVARSTAPDDVAGIIRFTDRLLTGNPAFEPAVHGVGFLASIRSERPTHDTVAAATRMVDVLAQTIRKTDPPSLPLDRIASSIGWLPWTSTGGRAGLLAALASRDRDVTSGTWWSGLDWQTLLAVGDGSLGAVLRHDDVKNIVTTRVIADGLARLDSRAALAQWIGAPRLVFEFADPAELGARVAQVVEKDAHLADAFTAVRREHTVSELRERAESAESQSASALRTAEDAARELAVVEEARRRLESDLAAAISTDRGVRASERRQAKLDGMKATAQILATATSEAATLNVEELTARLVAIAGRVGVSPRGDIGSAVEFDPAWCEAPGTAIGPGERCIVVRPAYEYVTEQEDPVLLFKAIVRAE